MRGAIGAALQVLGGRLRGRTPLLSASLYLTQRCNLRCLYCSSPLRRTAELTTADWVRILDELAALGCRRIAILGGEPLLRADLADIIHHAKVLGLGVVVTSNGLLVPRRIDALREIDTLVLSLDAAGPSNDAVRGEGVFAAVEAAIEAARGIGLTVKLNAVMTSETAPELDELLAFCERHDLCLTVNIARSGAPDLWNEAATVKDDDETIRRLCLRLAALARDNPRLLFSPETYRYAARWPEFSRDRLETTEAAAPGGPRCHAGRGYLSIDADGKVYPCAITFHRISGGNAAEDGVEAARRPIDEHACASCFSPCMVEQNFLYSLEPRVLTHFARRHLPRFS